VKRLGDVVLGAGLEPAHAVLRVAECREEHDRRGARKLAHPFRHLESRSVGKADVEEGEIEAHAGGLERSRLRGLGPDDLESLGVQALGEGRGDVSLVLHEEDPGTGGAINHGFPPIESGGWPRTRARG
jgi:hypothetical protein